MPQATIPGCTCGGARVKQFRATVRLGDAVERVVTYESECPCVSGGDPSRDTRPTRPTYLPRSL